MTDAPVVDILNAAGMGKVVLLCEHASNHIPAAYDGLGLAPDHRDSHAAWDPGALALTTRLSAALDAPAVVSRVSRLVYDCNRPPEAPSAMPQKSELIEVPGNHDLTAEQRAHRTRTIYDPFCTAVDTVLDGRGADTVIVTLHSFTPVYFGQQRQVELGLLHDTDSRLVDAMLTRVDDIAPRNVQRNAPYGPQDGVTHSLKKHALSRGLPNVMVEVRNDLLRTANQIDGITQELLALLTPALTDMTMKESAS